MGKATDALGLTNRKGEKRAHAASVAASERANEIAAESLAFQKEQYADWEQYFGPVRTEVAEYYNGLDADDFMSKALQLQQAGHQAAQKKISETLAQKGFGDNSKFEAHQLNIAEIANATNKASIRANAGDVLAQQKQNFLTLGLTAQQGHLGLINSAYGQGIGTNQHTSNLQGAIYQNLSSQNFAVKEKLLDSALSITGDGTTPQKGTV